MKLFPDPIATGGADELPEIIVDSFAGGGGASVGIEMALGRSPDVAINHDPMAIAMHAANHPETLHLSNNIWTVDPNEVMPGRRIGLLWASPDCTHHSKAKGGVPIRPANRNSRDLGWVIVAWAEKRRPRVISLENVEEWRQWGPLVDGPDGLRPDKDRAGEFFREWVRKLRRLGYRVEWKELRACDYGAPTIRKRLFVIARCDGRPIVWPKPTHGDPRVDPDVEAGGKRPWRTAAEIIDWSLPCPSIFDSAEEIHAKYGVRAKRPLAPATMARIAKGVRRYVLGAARPFIVPITHTGGVRVNSADEPLRTQTTAHRGEHAIATPFVTKFRSNSVGHGADEPLHTVTAHASETHGGGAAPPGVVAPFLVPRYGERPGQEPRTHSVEGPAPVIVPDANGGSLVAAFMAQHNTDMVGHQAEEPVSTIVGKGCTQGVVAAHLMNMHGADRRDRAADAPAPTDTAGGNHAAVLAAFMAKYYGEGLPSQGVDEPVHTVTVKPRHGLVTCTIGGEPFVVVDIGMRMLTARERFNAQGFPADYVIDLDFGGRKLSGEAQGRLVGNSVCPPLAMALVAANCGDLAVVREAAE